jgi:tight adherence protein B
VKPPTVPLLAFAAVLGLGFLGLRELVMGSARRADLRTRTLGAPAEPWPTAAARALAARFARTRLGHRIGVKLQAAAVDMPPLSFAVLAVAVGVAAGLLVSLKFGTVLAVLGGLLAIRGVWFWLEHRAGQRKDRFVAQLPELARVLSNGAAAGLSIVGALEIAAQELDEPARSELQVALEEVRIGQSFDRAFENLAERMPSRELGVLVSTLVIQQRSGGDLVHALSDMASTLEARKDTLREVRTIMSGAVASAYVVAALGVGTVFISDLIRPGSIDKMTQTPAGLAVLFVAAVLYTGGMLVIRRITRLET